jgi:hypothetical protein
VVPAWAWIDGAKDRRSLGPGIDVERGAVVPPQASDDGTCAAASLGEPFQEMAGWMRAEWRRAERRRRAFAALRGEGPEPQGGDRATEHDSTLFEGPWTLGPEDG